ncbi:uncharacterized protein LOC121972897 [Zingiber officinale]|uniref:uncharacterized protein LOC121972897 n=1 Tax=Zingiber officinale TaxID=94328 RepID=UPI001C4AFB20|nr:uncharacterized protein LOC121972897 [Zingiber officinale]
MALSSSPSSRVYYRACGRVPFDWEIEPGQPKSPAVEETAPVLALTQPLSPPPAVWGPEVAKRGGRDPRVAAATGKSKRSGKHDGVKSRNDQSVATPSLPPPPSCFVVPEPLRRWDFSRMLGAIWRKQ